MDKTKLNKPEEVVLLMGNEAYARGAIEAGIDLAVAYPGTPSTEILETLIKKHKDYHYYVEWSVNEKVALDLAAGASILGARTLVPMKNAGLNVAMDTLMTLVYGGIKGGMVLIVCDDPSAHYSSNEQDTRFAAMAAEIPCFEPSNQQEAKDMVKDAFDLSEKLELPVMVRSVSRISHGNGDVILGKIREKKNILGFNKHWKMQWRWNVYGPPGAVEKHEWLYVKLDEAKDYAEKTEYNLLNLTGSENFGIIASGLAISYVKESLLDIEKNPNTLYLGLSYPVPSGKVAELIKSVSKVIVVEEGSSFLVEKAVRAIAQDIGSTIKIYGKELNPIFTPYGEINTDIVNGALIKTLEIKTNLTNTEREKSKNKCAESIVLRSSTLCTGCPHLGTYTALKRVLKKIKGNHILNGDIGCYEQAGYGISSNKFVITDELVKKYPIKSTYELLDTIYVMGSSLSMAQGQVKVGYKEGKVMAIAGDSTFFHALLSSVINATLNDSDVTLLVLDNEWTAMTGHQPSPTSGVLATGQSIQKINIENICKAIGIKSVFSANAFKIHEVEEAMTEALNYKGFSVVIIYGECRLQFVRRHKKGLPFFLVDESLCSGCKICIDIGCPAISFEPSSNKAVIEEAGCNGCSICEQICPKNAIERRGDNIEGK
jgi:indolepyruvate ferredoxin oxidoreductase alpha subunit